MRMERAIRTDLLLAEYLHVQKVVEDFDAKSLTIKAWSVTLSAAGLVAAYTEDQPIVLLIAGFSALAFWLVEALWKTNQQAFYPRIRAIEAAFREGSEIPPLQIATSWSASWHAAWGAGLPYRVFRWPHVFLPHLPVALAAFGLYAARSLAA
jgi:hypothetical protein